jgi:hypothetical protein
MKDYYYILGVDKKSTTEEVKKAVHLVRIRLVRYVICKTMIISELKITLSRVLAHPYFDKMSQNILFKNDIEFKNTIEKVMQKFNFYVQVKQEYLDKFINMSSKDYDLLNWENKENYFFDLTNLMYVSENDYYWTEDKIWYNLAIKAGLKERLKPRQMTS